MINEQELFQQIQKAEQAGDTEHAQKVADYIKQQRTAFSKANHWTNNNIVNKYGIEGAREKLKELAPDKIADTMSRFDKIMVGMGKGFTDIGQGAQQLVMHGANAKLPENLHYDFNNLDERVKQENEQFNKDFEGDLYAKGGQFTGQTIATAPIGGAVASLAKTASTASRGANALNMAKQGALVGATEASLMPVLGDDFASEKLAQVGMGSTFGGALGGGLGAIKGGKELAQDGVKNTLDTAFARGGKSGVGKVVFGDADEMTVQKALYDRNPDVLATKGMKTGSKPLKRIEQWGRGNIFTEQSAADLDDKALESLKGWVSKQADNIAKVRKPSESTFRDIQKLPKVIINKLVKKRSAQATKDYGMIDNYAKGQKVIKLDNLNKAIDDFIMEQKGVKGSDAQKMYNQAIQLKKQFAKAPPKEKPYQYSMIPQKISTGAESADMTASQAMRQLQSWSSHSSGNIFKDIQGYGPNERVKKLFKDALLQDMDSVGGDIGGYLRKANKNYKLASQNMDQVKGSIFGEIAGKELVGDIKGVLENTIAPEKVMQKIRTSEPTRINGLMQYMDNYDPKLKKEFQAQYINNAVKEAMVDANTAGMEQQFNPATFLNSLGVTRGKNGWEGVNRLRAIYGNDSNAKRLINDMLALSRNAADAYGKNLSGTASHNMLNNLMGSVSALFSGSAEFVKKATATLSHYIGSKNVVENAYKDLKPFTKTINPMTNTASNLTALSTPYVVNQVNDNKDR